MKYPKPKLFRPSLEEQKSVAEKLSPLLSPSVGLVLNDGSTVKGTREKQHKTINNGNRRQRNN
jgi:hypothetical protein